MIWSKPLLWLSGAVLAILLAVIGSQAFRISSLKADAAEQKELAAKKHAAALQAYGDHMKTQLAEALRRGEAAQKAVNDAQAQSDAARRAADAAGDAVDRLRDAARAVGARGCPRVANPANAGSRSPAADPAAMLADVLGRVAREGADLARIADERGIAGRACEAERDSLTAR